MVMLDLGAEGSTTVHVAASMPLPVSSSHAARLPAIRADLETAAAATAIMAGEITVGPSMVVSGSGHDSSMLLDQADPREDSMQLLSDEEGELEEGGSRKRDRGESSGRAETQEERDKKRRAFKACE